MHQFSWDEYQVEVDEALAQAKEIADEAMKKKFGKMPTYKRCWHPRDARQLMGHDGFVLVYECDGATFTACIGANSQEMWIDSIS